MLAFILMQFLFLNVSNLSQTSCVVSIDNCYLLSFCRHTVGDTKVPFCLQSCVKPLKYAVAVNDYGTEYVHSFIGKEPSGLRFNKLFLDEDGELFSLSPSSAAHTCHFPPQNASMET